MKPSVIKCIMSPKIYQAALEFTANAERDEWGGIGIGSYTRAGEVLLKGMVFPPQYRHNLAYCAFESKYVALLKFALEDLGLRPQIQLVAWIHSHAGHGIFLSDMDQQTFAELLGENERLIALVAEPVQGEIGAFSGTLADQRIGIEQRELILKEEERIRLALLEWMLPEMVKILMPPMPTSYSVENLLDVTISLAEKIVKLRQWLAAYELGRQADQAAAAEGAVSADDD